MARQGGGGGGILRQVWSSSRPRNDVHWPVQSACNRRNLPRAAVFLGCYCRFAAVTTGAFAASPRSWRRSLPLRGGHCRGLFYTDTKTMLQNGPFCRVDASRRFFLDEIVDVSRPRTRLDASTAIKKKKVMSVRVMRDVLHCLVIFLSGTRKNAAKWPVLPSRRLPSLFLRRKRGCATPSQPSWCIDRDHKKDKMPVRVVREHSHCLVIFLSGTRKTTQKNRFKCDCRLFYHRNLLGVCASWRHLRRQAKFSAKS